MLQIHILSLVAIATLCDQVYGAYVNDFDQRVDFTCSNSKQLISRIRSIHDNGAEDRRFQFDCRDIGMDTNGATPSCAWSVNWENSLDRILDFECPKNGYVNGMISEHDNGAEDRRWKFYCCSIPDIHMYDCDLTGWTNDLDKPQDYQLPMGKAIKGVFSEHDNGAEDRRYEYDVCNMVRFNGDESIIG